MTVIKWNDFTFEGDYAVKGADFIRVYDSNFNLRNEVIHINPNEAEIEGEWTEPTDILTKQDALRADVDYLDMMSEYHDEAREADRADLDYLEMMTEYCSEQSEIDRADIDYLLMMMGN